MSMSTHVVGFRPPDETWHKMKKVFSACIDAGIEPPDEVRCFFEGHTPDAPGAEIAIEDATSPYSSEGCEGFDVDVTKLPPGLKIIRFYNSY